MNEYRTQQVNPDHTSSKTNGGIPVILLVSLIVLCLVSLGLGVRYYAVGSLNSVHTLLCLFLSINLLICFWETCLFFRRDYIVTRNEYWRERRIATGRVPAFEFFATKVLLISMFSRTLWADV